MRNIDEHKIVNEYKSGQSWKKISNDFCLDRKDIQKILIKNNIPRTRLLRINKDNNQNIIDDYLKGLSSTKISSKYDINVSYICKLIKKSGLTRNNSQSRRQYTLNETVFDNITKESAYWIGFLASDGNLYKRKRQNHYEYVIQIALANIDKIHLKKLQQFLKSDRPLINDRGIATKLSINSLKIFNSLQKFGLTTQKTFSLKICQDLVYNHDFWRGMIDGDGSIFCCKNGHVGINLTGSKHICVQFIEYLNKFYNYNPSLVKSKNVYSISIGKKEIVKKLLETLYLKSVIYLDRKYNKAKEVLKLL